MAVLSGKDLYNMVQQKTMDNMLNKASQTPDALAGHYTRKPTNVGMYNAYLQNRAMNEMAAEAAARAAYANRQNGGGGDTPGGGGNGGGGGGYYPTTTAQTEGYSGGDGGSGGGGGDTYVNPYESALSLLEQNYNNSVKAVNDRYKADTKQLKSNATDQLRQAYINYMQNKLNAGNQMARMGYTGGLTESNLTKLYNNYGNVRNDINKQLNQSIDKYNQRKNAELLNLLMNYNNQKMKYSI